MKHTADYYLIKQPIGFVSVGDEFTNLIHEYSDITIYLTLFNCTIVDSVPRLLEHNDLRWITPDQIPQYDFCPADTEILWRIQNGHKGL